MAINLNDNIFNRSNKAIEDKEGVLDNSTLLWRPFNSISEALNSPKLIPAYRVRGLTVKILKNGVNTEYWFRDGIADGDLIEKYTLVDLSAYELLANKQNSLNTDGSGIKYPTVDAVKSNLLLKQDLNLVIDCWGDSMTFGSGTTDPKYSYPSQFKKISGITTVNHGFPGYTSTQIKDLFLAYSDKTNPVIFWVGRNNYNDPTTVIADIATMVAALGHNRYLILGITNSNPGEQIGNSGYDIIVALNNTLESTYKERYIDIRKFLVDAYNPSIPQDVTDHGLDLPPTSLLSDNIHLNDLGYSKVAQRIIQSQNFLMGTGNPYFSSLKINGAVNPQGKGLELFYFDNNNTAYIQNHDRDTDTSRELVLQFSANSLLSVNPNGGKSIFGGIVRAAQFRLPNTAGLYWGNDGTFTEGINSSTSDHTMNFITDGISRATMLNGFLGIGTSIPVNKLVVSNSGAEGIEFSPGAATNSSNLFAYNRSTSVFNDLNILGTNVIIGTPAEVARFTSLGFNLSGALLKGVPSAYGSADLIIGNGASPLTSSAKIAVNEDMALVSNGYHAFGDYSNITITGTPDASAYATFDSKSNIVGNVAVNHNVGFQSRNRYSGSGNINAYMYGFNSINEHAGTGNIAEYAGLHINDILKTSSGTVTSDYGLKIEAIQNGTNNFAIHTNGGKHQFGGSVVNVGKVSNYDGTNFNTNQAKTAGPIRLADFSSFEAEGSRANMLVNMYGAATQADRVWLFQTTDEGINYDGTISLQASGGKVGIGNTSPVEVLDVTGKIRVSIAPTNPTDVVRKTELDLKAPLASPILTGIPAAPTAAPGTNTTQLATTAFVQASIPSNLWSIVGSDLKPSTINNRLYVENTNSIGGMYIKSNTGTTATFISAGSSNPVMVLNTSGSNKFATFFSSALKLEILNDGTINQYSGSGVQNSMFSGIIQAQSSAHFAYIDGNLGSIGFGPTSTNAIISADNLTAQRAFQMPDAAGTLALASQLPIAGSFSGVGTATTTFTVTIGTTQSNTTYKVNATPTNLLSAALFYITNKTTTTFDVVYLTGLTGTVTFDWSVLK